MTKEEKAVYLKKYYTEHKEKMDLYAKKYYFTHRNRLLIDHKIYLKTYRVTHKKQLAIYDREYRFTHKKERALQDKKYRKNRRNNDLKYILGRRMQSLLQKNLIRRGNSKAGRHWENLVGYNVNQLIKHLEKYFTEGMNWENRSQWHIDHKIPISAFNFTSADDIDFKHCWSLKNLQPLWKLENLKKGAKLDKPFQPSLRITIKKNSHSPHSLGATPRRSSSGFEPVKRENDMSERRPQKTKKWAHNRS